MCDKTLFSFGLVADVQYGNKENNVERKRYYKDAIGKLETCVANFNKLPLEFVINLGDIIVGSSSFYLFTSHNLY